MVLTSDKVGKGAQSGKDDESKGKKSAFVSVQYIEDAKAGRDYGNHSKMLLVPTEAPGAPTKVPAATEVHALPPTLTGYTNSEVRCMAYSRKVEWYGTREDVERVLERWRRSTASG